MQTIMAVVSVLLPWLLGIAVLLALGWPSDDRGAEYRDRDALPWLLRIGFGYVIGARAGHGVASRPQPRRVSRSAARPRHCPCLRWRRHWRSGGFAPRGGRCPTCRRRVPRSRCQRSTRWQRLVWIALIAWIALRFVLVAAEIAWRPLYPWDAWVQWATKARVWYELGRIVPFGGPDQWLAGTPGLYFDAAPGYYGDGAAAAGLDLRDDRPLGRFGDELAMAGDACARSPLRSTRCCAPRRWRHWPR